jgi:hypothetical protein
MNFKFNFGGDSGDTSASEKKESLITPGSLETPANFIAAREVFIKDKEDDLDEMAIEALFEKVSIHDKVSLSRCRPPNSSSLPPAVAEAIDKSDLVPGVYEGGFKIWEGSLDLVRFLHNEAIPLRDRRVIELGCGHGFPGIYALNQASNYSTLY